MGVGDYIINNRRFLFIGFEMSKLKQLSEDVSNTTADKKLWAAVLHTALLDLKVPSNRMYEVTRERETRGLADRETAQAWVDSDLFEIGSFTWVCEVLDLNPETIRAGIERLDGRTLKGRCMSVHNFGVANKTWGVVNG